MSGANLSKHNNIIFFVFFFTVLAIIFLHDKVFQYEDDKSFISEFLRSSRDYDEVKIMPSEEAYNAIRQTADLTIKAIKFKNFAVLKSFVHPKYGVRFSPYLYVKSTDMVFSRQNLEHRYQGDYVYNWGVNRKGEDVKMTFKEYYRSYIYNYDYAISTEVTYNGISEFYNVIDNVYQFYPNSIVVEYYADQEQDTESFLRLVFEQYKGEWFLSGIITINN